MARVDWISKGAAFLLQGICETGLMAKDDTIYRRGTIR